MPEKGFPVNRNATNRQFTENDFAGGFQGSFL
jgi:hypothetical protein